MKRSEAKQVLEGSISISISISCEKKDQSVRLAVIVFQ